MNSHASTKGRKGIGNTDTVGHRFDAAISGLRDVAGRKRGVFFSLLMFVMATLQVVRYASRMISISFSSEEVVFPKHTVVHHHLSLQLSSGSFEMKDEVRTIDMEKDLVFDKEEGFRSRSGRHIERKVVIHRAREILRGYLEPLIHKDRPIACINLHLQSNVGDTALMSAQLQLLQDLNIPNHLLTVNTSGPAKSVAGEQGEIDPTTRERLLELNRQNGTVLFAAGGNMGTIYFSNQLLYCNVVKLVPNARVIHLPQSIVVNSNRIPRFNDTVGKLYRSHKDLHLFLRDVESFQLANSLAMAPGRTHLCPDLAFYLGPLDWRINQTETRRPILYMKREDGETPTGKQPNMSKIDPMQVVGPIDWRGRHCPRNGNFRENANNHLRAMETKEQYYEEEMRRGTGILSQGKIVLTDRLHGQILSYLMGLPVVVLPDKTYKGRKFYRTWTHVSTNDTRFVEDLDDAFQQAYAWLDGTKTPVHTIVNASMSEKANRIEGSLMKTTNHLSDSARQFLETSQAHNQGITIICLTVSPTRFLDLEQIAKVADSNQLVTRFIVIWNKPDDQENATKVEAALRSTSEKVLFLRSDVNSLNNRYNPNLPIETDAVMVMDDDVILTSETISCMWNAWNKDPSKVYSFGDTRIVSKREYKNAGPPVGNEKDPPANFALPRMIFHRQYLSLYSDEANGWIREYVDTQAAHCDDIAFAAIATKFMNSSLQFVRAPHGRRHWITGRVSWVNMNRRQRRKAPKVHTLASIGLTNQDNRPTLREECSRDILDNLKWELPALETQTC